MNRLAILAFILGLFAIAGGVAWYLVHSRQAAIAPLTNTATSTGTVQAGDAIYTNGTFGFVVQYPESTIVENNFSSSYYHLAPTWRANAVPNATGTPIVSFVMYSTKSENTYPRYFSALVRVSASSDKREIAQCLKITPDQGETVLPDAEIGGVTWKAFAFQNAGMQQYVKGVSYRTMHDGQCIALEKIAVGSSYREDAPSSSDISDATLDKAYEDLDRVIQSFTFVRP
ncbi:MAG: hypothetical protein KA104_01235 [Candidatus Pacebacteria bacterium]|nr:hypothetical protein [Candidatus Paceibacterota bacterium]